MKILSCRAVISSLLLSIQLLSIVLSSPLHDHEINPPFQTDSSLNESPHHGEAVYMVSSHLVVLEQSGYFSTCKIFSSAYWFSDHTLEAACACQSFWCTLLCELIWKASAFEMRDYIPVLNLLQFTSEFCCTFLCTLSVTLYRNTSLCCTCVHWPQQYLYISYTFHT